MKFNVAVVVTSAGGFVAEVLRAGEMIDWKSLRERAMEDGSTIVCCSVRTIDAPMPDAPPEGAGDVEGET